MESIIHADIFFFVTTLAIIVLAIGFIVLFVYLFRIVKDVQHISKKVREESDRIIGDVEEARLNVKENGLRITGVVDFIRTLFKRNRTSRKKSEK